MRFLGPILVCLCASAILSCASGTGDGEPRSAPTTEAGAVRVWLPAFDTSSTGWLLNAWGSSGDAMYMVGGTTIAGVVLRYDGARASTVSLGVDVPLLNWAFGFGPSDVTVVGNRGTIVHFDGGVWTKQASPTTEDLWGIWGAAPNDLWAVGGRGLAEGQATLLHFDGATWSTARLPSLQKPNVWQLLKVWGTDAENVYAVGQRGVVLHWDGHAWTEELVGASDDLVSLWGTDREHIVAVGGRSNGIVSVWDGKVWHTTSLAPLPGLNGIWMRTPRKAHVAGAYGTLAALDLTTMTVVTADVDQRQQDFHGIFGDPSGRLWAVGGNLAVANPPKFSGLAYSRSLGAEE